MASPQALLLTSSVPEEKRATFLKEALTNAAESSQADGGLRFQVLQSVAQPDLFCLLRMYAGGMINGDTEAAPGVKPLNDSLKHLGVSSTTSRTSVIFPQARALQPFWNSEPNEFPKAEGPMDAAVVSVSAKPGSEEALKQAALAYAAASLKELGNLRFDVMQDSAAPGKISFFQVFLSASDAAKHKETDHFKAFEKSTSGLLAGDATVQKFTILGDVQPWQVATPFGYAGKRGPRSQLKIETLPLRDGKLMPKLGFGCYKVGVVPGSAAGAADAAKPAPGRQVMADAIAAGYRCFDCAQFYENEDLVGEALKASGVPREELYIISKVWTNIIYDGPAAVRAQVDKTIADLQCGYLDLYMVHWPVPVKHVEAFKTLLELKKEGKIVSVGVSNYTWEDLTDLREAGIKDEDLPSVNQIEINPFLYRKRTIQLFRDLNIQLQAYRALSHFGKSASLEDQLVNKIGQKHGRSASQILGRWCVQKGFQHIPKSEKRRRMDENAQIFDFTLDEEDLAEMENLTTTASLDAFEATYVKCVYRDTPMQGSKEGIKPSITRD